MSYLALLLALTGLGRSRPWTLRSTPAPDDEYGTTGQGAPTRATGEARRVSYRLHHGRIGGPTATYDARKAR